jgi:hypothetical protein
MNLAALSWLNLTRGGMMKVLLRLFTVVVVLCVSAEVAATPLSETEKANFLSTGVPACIAGAEKSQVKTVDWTVYCNCMMEKMANDMTKEDALEMFVASDADRKSMGQNIATKWVTSHEGTVRACLKSGMQAAR